MPVLPFPHYIKGFIFDEDELYISAYYGKKDILFRQGPKLLGWVLFRISYIALYTNF